VIITDNVYLLACLIISSMRLRINYMLMLVSGTIDHHMQTSNVNIQITVNLFYLLVYA
jgi:hypothetical protein